MRAFWRWLKTEKIGGITRPILVAGIRVGVAERSRLGSHRTAKPTVKGFSRVYAIGVKNCRFYSLRGRCFRYVRLHQAIHRRYGKKRGYYYILAQTTFAEKPCIYAVFRA